MTLREFFRALIRRWPVVLIGAMCTGAFGFLAVRDDGTYWSRSEIVFMAPSSTLYPNSLKTRSEDLIITAGVIAKRVTGPGHTMKFASADTDLIGIPDGGDYWLRLPDTGGQWAPNFGDQWLLLDVAASSPEKVLAIYDDVLSQIRGELDAFQREQGVNPVNDITVTAAPEHVVLHHITGSRIRAAGVTTALGAAATIGAVLVLELRSSRRRWMNGS